MVKCKVVNTGAKLRLNGDVWSLVTCLFADDAKLLKRVRKKDGEMLQKDLNNIAKWSHKWEMELNVNKCKVMEFGKGRNRVTGDHCLGNKQLSKTKQESKRNRTIKEYLREKIQRKQEKEER